MSQSRVRSTLNSSKLGILISLCLLLWGVPSALGLERDSEPLPPLSVEMLLQRGAQFLEQSETNAALDLYQAWLLFQENAATDALSGELSLNDVIDRVSVLQAMADIYQEQFQPMAAIEAYHMAQASLDRVESDTVSTQILRAELSFSLGRLYKKIEDYSQSDLALTDAIRWYGNAASLTTDQQEDFAGSLYTLGQVKEHFGDFAAARELYLQTAEMLTSLALPHRTIIVLIALGGIDADLGDYPAALAQFEKALAISDSLEAPNLKSYILSNMGWVYEFLMDYDQAIDLYQQALTLRTSIDDGGQQQDISHILNSLGYAHLQAGDFAAATENLEAARDLIADSDYLAEQIDIFDSLGELHLRTQQPEPAWENYNLSLRLAIQIQDQRAQVVTYPRLSALLTEFASPEVAIAFYKQTLNEIEQIRDNLQSLSLETQRRYAEKMSDSYRTLATLLLEQDRIFEAHQVLDLLKIQELEDYFQDVREDQTPETEKLPYLDAERTILSLHQRLFLAESDSSEPALGLQGFLTHPDIVAAVETLQQTGQDPALQPNSLQQLQQNLQDLPQTSVILYPLILEDRLELLLLTPEGIPIHKTFPVSKALLKATVTQLRDELKAYAGRARSNASKPLAGQLYDWIVRPFQAELTALGIENIIYIPDGVLHYIPLSVFYDQHQTKWLVEQYTSQNLTASSVGDLVQAPTNRFDILAGAFTDTSNPVEKQVGNRREVFVGLAYAGLEVNFLQEQNQNTTLLLDENFNHNNLQTQLQGQNIVHLATHGAFVPGRPEESFILLGDGSSVTLKDLKNWSLSGVELVVLSACQTGISHIDEGVEILGMGFQIQRTEALAALASLWSVNDRSTYLLMQQFYRELAAGATKVEALQRAQVHLIQQGWHNPYHWAPFVLIGNGL